MNRDKLVEIILKIKENPKDEELLMILEKYYAKYIEATIKMYSNKNSNLELSIKKANDCLRDFVINYRFINIDSFEKNFKIKLKNVLIIEVVEQNFAN